MTPPRTIKLLLALAIIAITLPAFAQKVSKQLSRQDVKNIYAQADVTLDGYIRHLNFISDPSLAANEIDEAIENQFSGDAKIFFNKTFEVDDDTNPENTKSGENLKAIDIYLRQFRNKYVQSGDNSISFDITQRSNVKVGQHALYVKLYYSQTNKGKSKSGKSYPKKLFKVAEMQVIQIRNGQYKTYISALDFADKNSTDDASNDVQITDGGQADNDNDSKQSDAWYAAMLQKGTRLNKENNFVGAYYALKEAKGGSSATEAENQLRAMLAKMRTLNIDVNENLSSGLVAAATHMDEKYRYDEAKKYYSYAKEVNPALSNTIAGAIITINEKQQKEQQYNTLLEKGSYSDAIQGFASAIKKDKDNPNLYVGLARGFEYSGDLSSAETAYKDALKAGPDNPNTYKWMGYYYKNKKDYEHAYESFLNYQIKADDKTDDVIQSEVYACQGISQYNKRDYIPAMESLQAASKANPANKEALLYQSIIYRNNKDLPAAKTAIESLIKLDDKFAEAHYSRGQIILASINAGNVNEYRKMAIEEIKLAIKYNPKNAPWYYDLGSLQIDIGDYENAILNFTTCINSPEKIMIQKLALWRRGKSFFNTNRFEEALLDYQQFVKVAATVPPAFYVDYGNVLIRQKKYTDALTQLNLARSNKEALLSMGIAYYVINPANEDVFMPYFEQAFKLGVGIETLRSDPNIRVIYEGNKRFKALVKSYNYHNLF